MVVVPNLLLFKIVTFNCLATFNTKKKTCQMYLKTIIFTVILLLVFPLKLMCASWRGKLSQLLYQLSVFLIYSAHIFSVTKRCCGCPSCGIPPGNYMDQSYEFCCTQGVFSHAGTKVLNLHIFHISR